MVVTAHQALEEMYAIVNDDKKLTAPFVSQKTFNIDDGYKVNIITVSDDNFSIQDQILYCYETFSYVRDHVKGRVFVRHHFQYIFEDEVDAVMISLRFSDRLNQ